MNRAQRAVAVLGDDHLRLALAVRVWMVHLVAIDEAHEVRVLLYGVMHHDAVGHEAVRPGNRHVVDLLDAIRLDHRYRIPDDVTAVRVSPRDGNPITRPQLRQTQPPFELAEGMVGGGPQRPTAGGRDTPHGLATAL